MCSPPQQSRFALATVCTRSHLSFARCMARSFREQHPEAAVWVAVVDAEAGRCPEVEGATTVAGEEIGGRRFPLLALKYTPFELCASLKPYLLQHVFADGSHDRLVYLDSDIYVFAPVTELVHLLDDHPVVATPHTVGPTPPHWDRRPKPMLAHVLDGGVLNSGMFSMRDGAEARDFLATWRDLCTRYGAFLEAPPGRLGRQEQHSFNWLTSFVDGAHVLRDTAYNVAYWNLHDRALRWAGLDGAEEDRWSVDGAPLVAFHFSGYSPHQPHVLTRHHAQYLSHTDPSVETLLRFYRRRLAEVDDTQAETQADTEAHAEAEELAYRFGRFPSGIAIDPRMRRAFKRLELSLPLDLDPWSDDGEAACCRALLRSSPRLATLVPPLIHELWLERPDLQAAFQSPALHPEPLLEWFASTGAASEGYLQLFEAHRPTSVPQEIRDRLTSVERESPALLQSLPDPLGQDRLAASRGLERAGYEALASALARLDGVYFRLTEIYAVRTLVQRRPDLRRAFPDLMDGDAAPFTHWLVTHGQQEADLPPRVAEVFQAKCRGRSLARIFCFLQQNPQLVDRWPLALVGVGSAALCLELMAVLEVGDPEYDLDDVLAFLWTMDEWPWKGLPLVLELSRHLCRKPCPRLPEGQDALLAPVLGDPRFAEALEEYRARHSTQRDAETEAWVRRFEKQPSVYAHWPPADDRPSRPDPGKINLFAPLRSAIGLGSMARGLVRSLAETPIEVNAMLVGNTGLDGSVTPADLVRRYRYDHGTNLFVSYPHNELDLLGSQPDHVVRGHRNVAYLAWEQRDGSPMWRRIFAGFDQLWTLSEFAAEPLRRFTGQEVRVVPCCVDADALPAPVDKESLGFDPARKLFLTIFDPQSSMERKNPGAVIEAFRRAFRPDDPVTLLLKASNPHCHEYKERLRQLLDAAADSRLDVRLQAENLPYDVLMGLVSACDGYLSLHRSEGFGLTCAEAMAYGRPVIATRYSGNLEFMDDDCSFLVDAREIQVDQPDGPYPRGSVWADPDLDQAAAHLRSLVDEPRQARRRGRAAARRIARQLSPTAVGRLVEEALSR